VIEACTNLFVKKDNVVDIEKNMPHKISEVVCLKCLRRWIAVMPEKTLLKSLECLCGDNGVIIETGENIDLP